uniref:Uncharacterized protein n=1 Tax=Knipowitschia caucasica TaxID=637954 RepID=A0AAV2JD98_KNICA
MFCVLDRQSGVAGLPKPLYRSRGVQVWRYSRAGQGRRRGLGCLSFQTLRQEARQSPECSLTLKHLCHFYSSGLRGSAGAAVTVILEL